ncbi:MAG TPA: FGGY-family carbohydrate kinase [Erysipelothrix sp.]|nr:FGGY-family carbohydrate kinase [Erysipelothrix sp.]
MENILKDIQENKTYLGIELGSTRIKGILIDSSSEVIAEGGFEWENKQVDGVWTYDIDEVWLGIQKTYKDIVEQVHTKYNQTLTSIGSIGFSAMMHGYLAFDKNDELLVPFRTWRNAMTEEAEKELTELFNHNIPQRWSIAHLYQAILNKEKHVKDIAFFTTLAGYVHWQLTGEKVLGIGDASGMFPIDMAIKNYDETRIDLFNKQIKSLGTDLRLEELLPKSLSAGENAGFLSEKGTKLLDPTGQLAVGIPFVPPEGDAGTGMVATNSIKQNTGNISAGTSVFAMIVLDKPLSKVYPEIDIVTTPVGDLVAMVHVNNCTTEINAWVNLFADVLRRMNVEFEMNDLFTMAFEAVFEADKDADNMLAYGYHSGENITKMSEGRPLLVRMPSINFNVSNLMKAQINSAFATLNIGMQILFEENVNIKSMVGHGGIFKTKGVAQTIVASAVESPLTVMETAGEGGAWGMAILAQYLDHAKNETLGEFLDNKVFNEMEKSTIVPKEESIKAYREFVKRYQKGLTIEKTSLSTFEGV